MPIREYRRNALRIGAASLILGALAGALLEIIHPTQETPCST